MGKKALIDESTDEVFKIEGRKLSYRYDKKYLEAKFADDPSSLELGELVAMAGNNKLSIDFDCDSLVLNKQYSIMEIDGLTDDAILMFIKLAILANSKNRIVNNTEMLKAYLKIGEKKFYLIRKELFRNDLIRECRINNQKIILINPIYASKMTDVDIIMWKTYNDVIKDYICKYKYELLKRKFELPECVEYIDAYNYCRIDKTIEQRNCKVGYVYFLSNESMPGLVKIGMTTKAVEERMKQLNTTGVPSPFELLHIIETDDVRALEQRIHDELSEYRIDGKEFFNISKSEIMDYISRLQNE